MKLASRIALTAGRRLSRGGWRAVRWAAARDAALWDLPLPLRFFPGRALRADMREPMFMNFLRHGCIEHQTGEDLLCMKVIELGDLVFDVGANLGYPTVLFARCATSSGLVIAFEPSPRAFALLLRNTEGLRQVECLQMAVSDCDGEAVFYETDRLDTSSLVPTGHARSYTVKTCMLDDVARVRGVPDFVKIDVEGHEAAVLHGMKAILGSGSPPAILFEAASRAALDHACRVIESYAPGTYDFFGILRNGTLCGVHETPDRSNYFAFPRTRELPPDTIA